MTCLSVSEQMRASKPGPISEEWRVPLGRLLAMFNPRRPLGNGGYVRRTTDTALSLKVGSTVPDTLL